MINLIKPTLQKVLLRLAASAALFILVAAGIPAAWATALSAEAVVLYTIQPGDTYIGISKRVLADPTQWGRLAERHGVDQKRLIPGKPLAVAESLLRPEPQQARVTVVSGAARVNAQPVAPGALISEGQWMETPPNASLSLELPDNTTITLGPLAKAKF
jgi:hypothetical protein